MLLFFYTKPVPDAHTTYCEAPRGDIWEVVHVGEQVTLRPRQLSTCVASSKLANKPRRDCKKKKKKKYPPN